MPLTAECFRVFQTKAIFWAISEKFPLGPPIALFQKMRVLGDLAKIAITWPFGIFCSRFVAPKCFPVFALEVHTN